MPRILRIHNRLIVGGPTLNVLCLAKYLSPGFETLLIAGEKESHEKDAFFLAEEMGIQTLSIPEMGRSVHPFRDYKAYRKIQQIIRNFKPDIVHTHAAKPGAVGRMAAHSLKVPVVVHTYHGHVFHSYFGKWKTGFIINTERYLATKTDAIVAISQQQKQELSEDFRIAAKDKFRVIPLGFELSKFRECRLEKRRKFREEFQLKNDEIAIGIIGRLVPVKNHFLFLEAIDHVRKNSARKIKAFIVGDGETRKALEQKAGELNIPFGSMENFKESDLLIFTSWRTDVDVINAGLDIIALTSLNEGTPVSLIEAQASGKPVVSTRAGGVEDIVKENETALLSDTDDQAGFRDNLLRLAEHEELRDALGKKGEKHVQENFSVEKLATNMSNLYFELLDRKNHG